MNRKRVIFALCALFALGGIGGGTVSAAQADEPPNHANRLDATFTETNVSITNRVADLGVFQLINTGTGTVEGLGSATLMLSATQDRSVHPCGPNSSTNAAIRRIVLADGVLVLRELAHVCPTPAGPLGTGTWEVDGASSTGIFAGARGSGEVTIVIPTNTATISGKLNLAG
jgi:hypothetical protein